ncbi:hypothetical protein ACFXAZ_38060 [Streptomyces sp. NPDC059477]|uniref:hypothetical protein n=1 Tax=Streptomyces sp. NPDC059477 TaxID=3346847 RepID=UPI0036843B33
MTSVLETYLGWDEPWHLVGCKRPSWLVDFRTDPGEYRSRRGGEAHACANEDCGHGDRYPRTTVRIVCPSCQAALVVRGEDASTRQGTTATTAYGYGMPARSMAGLLLWPGEPRLRIGHLRAEEPFDFLVTGKGVKRPAEADVVGAISEGRGKRGGTVWHAVALPSPGKYGRFNWGRTNEDAPARTVAAAAKWIRAGLDVDEQGGDAR